MTTAVETQTRPRRRYVWILVVTQLVLVAAYAYAAGAFLTTEREYFPEQAPPSWSWPAVIVVGIGWLPALACLMVAILAAVSSPDLRADRRPWAWLVGASAAAGLMLAVMATPPGWELFDWYVG